ncbi:SMP-30/Gluconolaconase/LRE-like region-domain-containing protein [Mycena albidolilacea]|uniref:SMP-30/Gluconolaconase/LRE-like region-domain-containing protein n=1 Tax=Mycena albidolilacea TaxID=1033008 RepID=A0AAD7AKX0_9AGAR|nr:SMP-30/Gluconolaconase/LRE-like region-domain-containing protein [Mycena albidolilacea]
MVHFKPDDTFQCPQMSHFNWVIWPEFLYRVFSRFPLALLHTIMVTRIVVDRPLLTTGCTLGEGPVYDPETGILHFVDIDEYKIYHLHTETLDLQVEQFDEKIGCIALRRDGPGLAGAAAQGFALFEGDSTKKYVCQPLPTEYQNLTRFNDGACDSKGRFFAGTVYDQERGVPGQLWKYDPADGSCSLADPGPFTDSNGLGWTQDEQIFYFTDSRANIIYAYDYDDGTLSNRRLFVDAMALGFDKDSYCDGLCIDIEGYVWSARWGGSQVVRFSPSGSVDLIVDFPTVLNITACTFGGPKNDQLYVTSAHCKASGEAERQAEYPDSGHLFVVDLSGKQGDKQYTGVLRHKFGVPM